MMNPPAVREWANQVVEEKEIERYLERGRDFIDEDRITRLIRDSRNPAPRRVREILARSLALERLDPADTAALIEGFAFGTTMKGGFAPDQYVIFSLLLLVIVSLVSLYPASFAARMEPVEALHSF